MVFFKSVFFHLICCAIGGLVIGINFMWSSHKTTEFALYFFYSLFVVFYYFKTGYKLAEYDVVNWKSNIELWYIFVLLLVVSLMDIRMGCLLNMSFQPLIALATNKIISGRLLHSFSA